MPAADQAGAVSRREVLAAAGGALVAAAALSGCGSSTTQAHRRPEDNGADAAVLDALLGVLNRSVAVYAYAADRLTGAQRALARRIGVQEAGHVYALSGAIDRLGGTPSAAPPPGSYGFDARNGPAALVLAARTEDATIAACIDAMPKLTDLEARGTVGSIANNDAQHAVLIAQARRLPPLPAAIVRGHA
ncbi:MAG: ferritin-like domain-containing protein [Actinobacteria bacterium]|nr:ferritin-like domain-containing protein [Actinomycetota bacterium]